MDEVQGFTGTNADAHDDQVDALGYSRGYYNTTRDKIIEAARELAE